MFAVDEAPPLLHEEVRGDLMCFVFLVQSARLSSLESRLMEGHNNTAGLVVINTRLTYC